ncbi:MAG: TRAP transporter small permease [Termitinemataceae bacterium]|nr:MAG: TRAP transporter small permease [Termitinemataceae bacterium]
MKKFYQAVCKFEKIFTGVAFVAIVALVLASAILRGLHLSLSWNIDLAILLLAWASFLGADCAFRDGQLIGIDLLTRRFSQKGQKIIEILVLLAILSALVMLFCYGLKLVWSDRTRTYSSLPISYSWATLSLPVASFSMTITTILKIKEIVLWFKSPETAKGGAK